MNYDDTVWAVFGNYELLVPGDLAESYGPGPFDDAAAHYGPIIRELNAEVPTSDMMRELEEYGLDLNEIAVDEVWEYVSWLVAGNLYEESEQ